MGSPSPVLAEVFLQTCCGTSLSDTSSCMTVGEVEVGLVCAVT